MPATPPASTGIRYARTTGRMKSTLIGNPPYGGSKKQRSEQKPTTRSFSVTANSTKISTTSPFGSSKTPTAFGGTRAERAFVSTTSVVQSDHAGLIFPFILDLNVETGVVHNSFEWENNAKGNAGVTVVVIGLRATQSNPEYLFTNGVRQHVKTERLSN